MDRRQRFEFGLGLDQTLSKYELDPEVRALAKKNCIGFVPLQVRVDVSHTFFLILHGRTLTDRWKLGRFQEWEKLS